MSEWKAKRFWVEAKVVDADGRFTVELDGRAIKTPAKRPLVVPTYEMAKVIAQMQRLIRCRCNMPRLPICWQPTEIAICFVIVPKPRKSW